MLYDVIILGAGPAGISASLYTTRGNLKTMVIENNESSLEKADLIDNYYGFENGIKGKDLYKIGIKQVKNLGVEVKTEEVIKIEIIKEGFLLKTVNGEYKTKSVVLATGNKRNRPQNLKVEKYEGKGISYCAICDGFFYKNKSVSILGSGNYAISETNDLINIVKDITILTNGEPAPEFRSDNVRIDTRIIKQINGENRVEEVEFEDGDKIKTNGIFIAQGVAGSTEFAKKLGAIINKDKIIINEKMETNIKGLYACGDCTGGLLQVSKAVYEGAEAGIHVVEYIKDLKNKI